MRPTTWAHIAKSKYMCTSDQI